MHNRTVRTTNLDAVASFLRQRALRDPERRIKITGQEIAEQTGLALAQVHDVVFMLMKRGFLEKEQPGARFRPMILRILDVPDPGAPPAVEASATTVHCPNCYYPLDALALLVAKRDEMERQAQVFDERMAVLGTFGTPKKARVPQKQVPSITRKDMIREEKAREAMTPEQLEAYKQEQTRKFSPLGRLLRGQESQEKPQARRAKVSRREVSEHELKEASRKADPVGRLYEKYPELRHKTEDE